MKPLAADRACVLGYLRQVPEEALEKLVVVMSRSFRLTDEVLPYRVVLSLAVASSSQ